MGPLDGAEASPFKGYPVQAKFLNLLEKFYTKCNAGEGKYTKSGITVGECKLFTMIHACVLQKGEVRSPLEVAVSPAFSDGGADAILLINRVGGFDIQPLMQPPVASARRNSEDQG